MSRPATLRPVQGQVRQILAEVAAAELLPHFGRLEPHQVHTKGGGDIVTEADLGVERELERRLTALLPGSVVVGEEGVHANPDLLGTLAGAEATWVVDPLDGTRHFARGEPFFGIMVALIQQGVTESAWIHMPLLEQTVWASRGQGAFVNGARARVRPAEPAVARGGLLTRHLPPELRETVEAGRAAVHGAEHHRCAAQRYFDIVGGHEHYALYYRTLPWDHLPGILLVEEAGGVARRFDGTPVSPGDGGTGLLVATDPDLWSWLRNTLLPTLGPSPVGLG